MYMTIDNDNPSGTYLYICLLSTLIYYESLWLLNLIDTSFSNYYVDPLSSYPALEQLRQLECDQWLQLGVRLGLGNDQLETIKKSQRPITAATLVLRAAKIKNIDMQWKDIVKALVSIGEYELAESVCTQQGQQMTASVKCV